MSAPVASPRGPAELGAVVRRAAHVAADAPGLAVRPEPLADEELARLLSRTIATARSYSRRYDAAGAHRRARDYAALERAADVLLTSERLRLNGFEVDDAPETAFLQRLHALGPRLGGSVGGGRAGDDEAFDDIADAAVRIIRRRVRLLLGVVA